MAVVAYRSGGFRIFFAASGEEGEERKRSRGRRGEEEEGRRTEENHTTSTLMVGNPMNGVLKNRLKNQFEVFEARDSIPDLRVKF